MLVPYGSHVDIPSLPGPLSVCSQSFLILSLFVVLGAFVAMRCAYVWSIRTLFAHRNKRSATHIQRKPQPVDQKTSPWSRFVLENFSFKTPQFGPTTTPETDGAIEPATAIPPAQPLMPPHWRVVRTARMFCSAHFPSSQTNIFSSSRQRPT